MLGFVVGGFFIFRAVMELLVVDFGDPSSYAADWGGPSHFGVLLVHMDRVWSRPCSSSTPRGGLGGAARWTPPRPELSRGRSS
ncbi:hypothetical protein [Glycomyces niveus]|uniref:Uncharacterized protein n=1 Tax=Glycomyces niveus TaxID=2820287 RepID=A0ABS3UAH1_9ACTN|nr:hypothetical protein [Glycomyces sp. NEAU-S30]MBO3735778.1 hypothetical protein [Glycomyces sp. NEAU-S30]